MDKNKKEKKEKQRYAIGFSPVDILEENLTFEQARKKILKFMKEDYKEEIQTIKKIKDYEKRQEMKKKLLKDDREYIIYSKIKGDYVFVRNYKPYNLFL